MQRHCHGIRGQGGCGFSWPDMDDWKYSLHEGKGFATREEYEALMAKIRSTPVVGLGGDWRFAEPIM